MEIKVLGPGCANCHKTEEIVRQALTETGIEANLEHIKKPMSIARYGVFTTPAVVVNNDVKIVGKIPTVDDVKGWLEK